MAQCHIGTQWAGLVQLRPCRASTCPHPGSLWAFENSIVFGGLREGVGGAAVITTSIRGLKN